VTVVTGASPLDRAYEAEARGGVCASLDQRVNELTSQVRAENEHLRLAEAETRRTLVRVYRGFLTSLAEDSDGEAFPPLDIAERLSRAANAPLYSWINLYVGHGIVGGRMESPEVQATRTAELALRVLKGERPETIPDTRHWTTTQFDWAQLARWGIDDAVAAGADLFRPPSAWNQYAGVIAGSARSRCCRLHRGAAGAAGRRREVALRERIALSSSRRHNADADLAGRRRQEM
jgi:hypothetical protein